MLYTVYRVLTPAEGHPVIDALHPGYDPTYKTSTCVSDKREIYMLYRANCTAGTRLGMAM